jgi:tetratricopeptide (TPR) repeat protein
MHDRLQSLQRAVDLHRRGRLAAAEEAYLRLLREQPDNFDALHFLGVLRYQQRRFGEALSLIATALRHNPSFPPALLNHGLVLDALGRPAEALASYDRALTLQPNYAEALFNRGVVLRRLARLRDALAAFAQALSVKPDYVEALYNRACLLREVGHPREALADFDRVLATRANEAEVHNQRGLALMGLARASEALAAFDRAVALRPDYAVALNNRANALQELQRPQDALASYDRALSLRPDYVEALYNRGGALRKLQRPAEALASYEATLAVRPDHVDALVNRGVMLRELQRPAEALKSYEAALALRGDNAEALYNRGGALRELQRPAEALKSYEAALAIKADHVDALNNRGLALVELQRTAEAIASYDRALALRPDFAEAHWNRGWSYLLSGDFERGWPDLEWRWGTEGAAPWRRGFPQPLWLGAAPLAGKTILLHGEQGFGDDLQFVRYVPRVAELAGKVILEVPSELTGLFSRMPGPVTVMPRGAQLPTFDCHCPLLSLPLAFNTRLDTIPSATPYLFAAEERLAKWRERLPPSGKRRVGVVWAGSPRFQSDQNRSIGLPRLAPLLSVAGIEFLSLQKDLRPGDREALQTYPQLTHLGDAIEDFDDTAAIVSLLDLVIGSDTSVVHLVGALGKPIWILLQYAADWRWLEGRSDNPWYPTARLFRQPTPGDWSSVVEAVKAELARG